MAEKHGFDKSGKGGINYVYETKEFDEVLTSISDGFGRWQTLKLAIIFIIGIPVGFQNLAFSFLAATPEYWCKIPEISDTLPNELQRHYGIPPSKTKAGQYSQCLMYSRAVSPTLSHQQNETIRRNYLLLAQLFQDNRLKELPEGFFSAENVTRCEDGWVYDTSEFGGQSIVAEWDLVCDRAWLAAMTQTIYMLGFLIGCVVFGSVSDRLGRKRCFLITIALMAGIGTVIAFSQSYLMFAVLRLFLGATSASAFSTGFVYLLEVVGPQYRNRTGNIFQVGFSIGYMLMPLLSILLPYWRHFQLSISCWIIILLAYYFVVPESPRWLYANGREKECMDILQQIAKTNKCNLSPNIKLTTADEHAQAVLKTDGTKRKPSIVDTVRTPNMRKKSIVLIIEWMVVAMVYYGLSLNSVNAGGNPYLNFFLSGIVEVPAYLAAIPVCALFGRRLPLIGTMLLGGVSCLVVALPMTEAHTWVIVTLSTFGKFCVSVTFAIIYLYSGEIYPTVIRQVGLGSNSMGARIGAMVAPQISLLSNYGREIPFLIFGISAIAAGVLALVLPETKDRQLPESITDGELFGKDQKFWTLLPQKSEKPSLSV